MDSPWARRSIYYSHSQSSKGRSRRWSFRNEWFGSSKRRHIDSRTVPVTFIGRYQSERHTSCYLTYMNYSTSKLETTQELSFLFDSEVVPIARRPQNRERRQMTTAIKLNGNDIGGIVEKNSLRDKPPALRAYFYSELIFCTRSAYLTMKAATYKTLVWCSLSEWKPKRLL